MSPRSVRTGLVIVACVAAGVVVGSLALRSTAADNPWACEKSRLATQSIQNAPEGGYSSPRFAVKAWLPQLATEGTAEEDDLDQAFNNDSGPFRFEAEGGRLFIDDRLQAEFGVEMLLDKSFAVSSVTYCSEPPGELGTPGETPTLSAEPSG